MTFAVRTFLGLSSGGPVSGSYGVSNNSGSTGIRGGSLNLLNDGTATETFHGSSTAASPWYSPLPAPGIGSFYWCKLTINSSSGTTVSGSTGSILSLASGAGWSFTSTGAITEGTGTATLNIYGDAGGSSLLSSFGVSWDVGYTP